MWVYVFHVFVFCGYYFLDLLFENDNSTYSKRTSAPTGAWKCNFPPFQETMTDRPTNQTTSTDAPEGL